MRVPVYESKVRTQAIDAPKVGVAPTGLDELAKGISQVGAVASNIGEDYAREVDEQHDLMANNVLNQYKERETVELYDNENGLYSFTGESVYTPGKDGKPPRDIAAKTALQAYAKELIGKLPESARLKAEKALGERVATSNRAIETYSGKAINKAKEDSAKLSEDYLFRDIEANPELLNENMIRASFEPTSKFRSEAENEMKVAAAVRALDLSVMRSRMKSGDFAGAKEYLTPDVRTRLGKEADKVEDAILTHDVLSGVFDFVTSPDNVYKSEPSETSKGGELQDGWVDHNKARQNWQLKRQDIPEEKRAAADSMFERELTAETKRRKAKTAGHLNNAIAAFARNNSTSDIPFDDATFLREHARELWAKFEDKERAYLKGVRGEMRAEASAGRAASGGVVDRSSETITLMKLRQFISDNPQAAASMSEEDFMLEWGQDLGSQLKSGAGHLSRHKEKAKDPSYLVKSSTKNMIVDQAVRPYELNPKKSKVKAVEIRRHLNTVIMLKSDEKEGFVVTPDFVKDETDKFVAAQLGRPDPVARSERKRPVVPDEPAAREAPAAAPKKSKAARMAELVAEYKGKMPPAQAKAKILEQLKLENY